MKKLVTCDDYCNLGNQVQTVSKSAARLVQMARLYAAFLKMGKQETKKIFEYLSARKHMTCLLHSFPRFNLD
jgi:hypothetical protein